MGERTSQKHPPKIYFADRLMTFIDSLPTDDDNRKLICKEICRLVTQTQDGMGSMSLRRITFDLNLLDQFSAFKNEYLDYSAYINRMLWLNVHDFLNGHTDFNEAEFRDCEFVISNLSEKEIEKIKNRKFDRRVNVDNIDLKDFETGLKKRRSLMPYIKSKAKTLRFVTKYDSGIHNEDFTQDIACELTRIYNNYGKLRSSNYKGDIGALQKGLESYIEMALNNKINHLKEYHTCESRRRVSVTNSELYRKKKRLKKERDKHKEASDDASKALRARIDLEILNLKETIREQGNYFSKVVPITTIDDEGHLKDQENEHTVCDPTKNIEDQLWLEEIKTFYNDVKTNMYFRACQGDDAEFKLWCKKRKINRKDVFQLGPAIRKYLSLSEADIKELRHNLTTGLVHGAKEDLEEIIEVIEADLKMINATTTALVANGTDSISSPCMDFIDIVMGRTNKGFDNYVKGNSLEVSNFNSLVTNAKRYLQISRSDLVSNKPFQVVIEKFKEDIK